jgi:glycine oxidase
MPFTAADPIVRSVERYDAVVVGGGIIGLACAWRARERGLDVCVVERDRPGAGATRVAAGVLAPDPETPGFTALARRSAELWPAFAAALGDVGYTRCGSLVLAFDGERPGELPAELLDADACRALEPGIAADCTGGLLLADDAQVDPRRVAAALAELVGDGLRTGADVVALTPDSVELASPSGCR